MFHLRAPRPLLALATALFALSCNAQTTDSESWNAKFQATYIWQSKGAFYATYSGANSLSTSHEKSYSFSAGAAFGLRPWAGAELYFDPEVVQGVPFSNQTGLGGFSNAEIARASGTKPVFYRARLFLRQAWGLGGGAEAVESDANQLAGPVDKNRFVLTAGNLSVLDLFDDNAYSHDGRTQFLNGALVTHGAYDYAADARGYSWGAALEYFSGDWALRTGRFIEPEEPNQRPLDPAILHHYGDQAEIEHAHMLGGFPGKLRLLVFRNRVVMSGYRDAIAYAATHGGTPDLNAVRHTEKIKAGFGLNLEQSLAADIGMFARASRSDGKTETYSFSEIDRSVSAGVVMKGNRWGRGGDSLGIALVRNGLSPDHRDYLRAGGLGFFIGDGKLNYRPETIVETYYSLILAKGTSLSFDFQHFSNPAYNADRGPVKLAAVRLHAEF